MLATRASTVHGSRPREGARLQDHEGTVLTTNQRMLKFVRRLGFVVLVDPEDPGTLRVVRPLGQ